MTTAQRPTVFAVLLAAGESRRFKDQSKLAATVQGKPILQRACEVLAASSVDASIVVLGPATEHLYGHCDAAGLNWTINHDAANGQSTSVRCGLAEAPKESVGCLFMAADQPLLDSSHIDHVLELGLEHSQVARAVARPHPDSPQRPRRGTPVYFPRRYFDQLREGSGDEGGRQVLRQLRSDQIVDVEVPALALIDVDTRDDLELLHRAATDGLR